MFNSEQSIPGQETCVDQFNPRACTFNNCNMVCRISIQSYKLTIACAAEPEALKSLFSY